MNIFAESDTDESDFERNLDQKATLHAGTGNPTVLSEQIGGK